MGKVWEDITGQTAAKEASDATNKSTALQQRIADVKTARERLKTIREARTASANTNVLAQAGGTTGSSGQVGSLSSIQSQLQGNLSFLDTTQDLAQEASIFNQKAQDARQRSAAAGQTLGIVLGLGAKAIP